jgi:hypothetical protein
MKSNSGDFAMVSLEEPIVLAKEMLEMSDDNENTQWFWRMAKMALGKMRGLSTQSVQVTEVDVVDGCAEIPNGCLRILGIRYCSGVGQVNINAFADFTYIERCNIGFNVPVQPYGSDIRINNNQVQFQYPPLAPKRLKIAYMANTYDNEGFPFIREHYVDAVMSYICYNAARRWPRRYSTTQHDQWYGDWVAQRNYAVGYDAVKDWQNNLRQTKRIHSRTIVTF